PGSRTSLVEFGSRAQLAGAAQSVPTASTDLSAALTLAGSVLSRDQSLAPEIVLVTDGWDTSSSVPTDSLPPGIAVSYVALPQPAEGQRPPAVMHGLAAPSVARAGDRVDIEIDLQASQSVDAQLRLAVDQSVIANGPIHLEPGETHMSLPALVAAPGFVRVRAELRTGNATSALGATVVAKPAGHVLVLE